MKSNKTLIISAVAVIALMGASFYGGILTQKSLAKNSSSTATAGGQGGSGFGGGSGGGGGGFRRGGGNAVFGTVQSISGTTMVVTTQSGNKTVSLASNPTVTDSSGNQDSISSIQTGNTVIVFGSTGSDGTVTATRVRLNPMAGGGGGGGFGGGGASGSTEGSDSSSGGSTPSGT